MSQTNMSDDSKFARVQAGVALLDAKMPYWRSRINPGILDINHADNCIIGQVFQHEGNPWLDGLERLGFTLDDEIRSFAEHGFDIRLNEDEEKDTRALEELWKEQLS